MSKPKIINSTTSYSGDEHPYLRGVPVRIIAVLHQGNVEPDESGESLAYQILRSDADIERFGGVTAADRVEVLPFIPAEGRYSWVSADPRAIDLMAFAHLTTND